MLRPLERGSTGRILRELGIDQEKNQYFTLYCDVMRYRFLCLFDFFTALFLQRRNIVCTINIYIFIQTLMIMLMFILYYSCRSDVNIIVSARDVPHLILC